MITVSVPGKVHIMGEHAVVYGKPAILAAINKRLTVSIKKGEPNATGYVADILSIVQKHLKTAVPLTVTVKSDIPEGYHLGSSAAVAVGVVAAALYCVRKVWNPQLANQLAYEAEKIKHGNPSGGDNTIVSMGGFLWYRKELEFLKSIWQLPFKTKLNNFYLIDTGKPAETTGEMVDFVRSQVARSGARAYKQFDENEAETRRIAVALKENDEQALISAIRKGEQTLERMGVVSAKAKKIIRGVEATGGAAKILGGGGKADGVGYLLCYTRKPHSSYERILLGEEGMRLESNI